LPIRLEDFFTLRFNYTSIRPSLNLYYFYASIRPSRVGTIKRYPPDAASAVFRSQILSIDIFIAPNQLKYARMPDFIMVHVGWADFLSTRAVDWLRVSTAKPYTPMQPPLSNAHLKGICMKTQSPLVSLPALQTSVFFVSLMCILSHTSAFAAEEAIATDRPDFVESAQVVGRGKLQFETGLSYEKNSLNGINSRSFSTPTLLRFGVADTWEFRVETDGFMQNRQSDPLGASQTLRGFADTSLGIKWQMQDGDEAKGTPALAWLAHADLASGATNFRGQGVRPSLRLVAEWELPGDTSVGIMPGLMWNTNDEGKRYTMGIMAITVSTDLGKGWRGFVEVAGQQLTSKANGGNVVTFDTGVSYLINNDTQIDFAISKGISKAAANLQAGIGLSLRF